VAEGRRGRRVALGLALLLLLLLLGAGGSGAWLNQRVRASLPQLEGRRTLPGLQAPVTIGRDARGVPRIEGATRLDLARATGFLHAQERFFQMDLLRRRAAGELSELIGPATIKLDREMRVHRFRHVAEKVVAAGTAEERGFLEAYAAGVNEGLQALGAPPFEYLALRVSPVPWRPEDSALASLAMFVTLQGNQPERESMIGLLRDLLPAGLASFLDPRGSEWDAPVEGEPFATPPIPGPDVYDLRKEGVPVLAQSARRLEDVEPLAAAGSNNWAVAGAHTASGAPLLADDMHLAIGVPNTWYRASLVWTEGGRREVTGVTLPGTPSVIVGSNGHVAWGFTNSEGDWADLVEIEPDPQDGDAYRTPEGPRRFERMTQRIKVKGAPEETLEVVGTVWGPVVDKDHRGRARALRWVAHDPEGVNLRLTGLETAQTLAEAQEVANRAGIPAQNFVAVDRDGHIGWTIMGRMPRRVGFDGRAPSSWADGQRRWDGWREPADYPRLVDPPGGRIWTANARVVGGAMYEKLQEGAYDLGARAGQIRDDLRALEKASERDLLNVQLDDRALFLARWRDLLLKVLGPEAVTADPRRGEMRKLAEDWGGRASVDSAGYRIVRAFRLAVAEAVLGALVVPCKTADERFLWSRLPFYEGPLWALLTERPAHLLSPKHRSWDDQLLAAADTTLAELAKDGARLAALTWGARNTTLIQHPLSRAVPSLARLLDVTPAPLPGDSHMPRFQSPTSGASERLVVSPGRESEGIFHMPVGQSGHPLSPNYQDGHAAWARGEATAFLPGAPVHVLTLLPAEETRKP
jgi:penicillin amidase